MLSENLCTSWKEFLLTDLCHPKQWKTISKNQLTESGYPVYGANGKIGFFSKYNHKQPTLMITCRGATCGTLNISEPYSYITGNAMALDDLDENKVEIEFLYFCLSRRGFSDVISGSAQPQITRQGLEKVIVKLPPLKEQRRIVDILKRADGIRHLRKQAQDTARQLIPALFIEMFGDPATNSKGWDIVTFEDVGTLDRGKSKHRPRNDPALFGGPYPFIQTGDVAKSDGVIRKYSATYSEVGLQQSRLWPAGTLCITIAANIADTTILGFDACFPDSVVGFIPNDMVRSEYAQYWLTFLKPVLEASAPQLAQKNINLKILRSLPIIVPPIELQDEFVTRLGIVKSIRDQQEAAQIGAESSFQSLLHQAFQ